MGGGGPGGMGSGGMSGGGEMMGGGGDGGEMMGGGGWRPGDGMGGARKCFFPYYYFYFIGYK